MNGIRGQEARRCVSVCACQAVSQAFTPGGGCAGAAHPQRTAAVRGGETETGQWCPPL